MLHGQQPMPADGFAVLFLLMSQLAGALHMSMSAT